MIHDLRVERSVPSSDNIHIYGKLGGGHIEVDESQAEFIRDRLNEVLEDG